MINTNTRWHDTQRARLLATLDIVESLEQPTRGQLGARLISLYRAVHSLNGKQRAGSNHHTVSALISEVEQKASAARVN